MAFPTVNDTDTAANTVTVNSDPWTLTYPSNISSGNLLLCFIGHDGASGASPSMPSGWVNAGGATAAGSAAELDVWYKIATGSESGTFSFSPDASEQGCWRIVRISNWHGTTPPEVSTAASGTSANPNPNSLTPSWGSADTLWFAANVSDGARDTTVFSSSYTNGFSDNSGGGAGAGLGTCRRENATATEDPGQFTISASDQWGAVTVAVRPSAAASVTPITATESGRVGSTEARSLSGTASAAESVRGQVAEDAFGSATASALEALTAAVADALSGLAETGAADTEQAGTVEAGHLTSEILVRESDPVGLSDGVSGAASTVGADGVAMTSWEQVSLAVQTAVQDAVGLAAAGETSSLLATLIGLDTVVSGSTAAAGTLVELRGLSVLAVAAGEAPDSTASVVLQESATAAAVDVVRLTAAVVTPDSVRLTADDVAVVLGTMDVAEMVAFGETERTGLSLLVSLAESLRVAQTEQSAQVGVVATTDAVAARLTTEAAAFACTVSAASALGITVADAMDVLARVTRTDAVTVLAGESGAVLVLGESVLVLDVADTLRAVMADAAMVHAELSAAATVGLPLSEATAVLGFVDAAETVLLPLASTGAVAVLTTVQDAIAAAVTDDPVVLVRVSQAEAAALQMTTAAAVLVNVGATDLFVGLRTDTLGMAAYMDLAESVRIDGTDAPVVLTTLAAVGESVGLSLAEVAEAVETAVTTAVVDADTLQVVVSESGIVVVTEAAESDNTVGAVGPRPPWHRDWASLQPRRPGWTRLKLTRWRQ